MNFRHHQAKPLGPRSGDLPNPWMTDEEFALMRRQNPQFHSVMPNMNPTMQPPLLNQPSMLSPSNRNYMNPNSCKMSSSNFTQSPNPDFFKSPHSINESVYSNRFMGDRFSSSSYSNVNLNQRMNEGPIFKDFPASNMMSPILHKNNSDISKPLFSNMRLPQDRPLCMENNQTQFPSKYDNSLCQGKEFPFSNQKESLLQNPMSFNDKSSASVSGSNAANKYNNRPSSLFPAYSPKDNEIPLQRSQSKPEENIKNVHQSVYSSDFASKSSSYCDKQPMSPKYSKTTESFLEKDSYIERNVVGGFSQHNKSSFMDAKSSTICNSPIPQDSLKSLDSKVSSPNPSYPFTTGNQQVCFQSSSEIPFQTSESIPLSSSSTASVSFQRSDIVPMPNHPSTTASSPFQRSDSVSMNYPSTRASAPFQRSDSIPISNNASSTASIPFQRSDNISMSNRPCTTVSAPFQRSDNATHTVTTASRDCLMQNTQLSSQSDIHQASKESFSTFSFESNINTTDIADLLPGLDAFLKETLEKAGESGKLEEDATKNNFNKTSVSNCAFSDDEWSKHSIPFIGDNKVSSSNNCNQSETVGEPICEQITAKEKYNCELLPEKTSDVKFVDVNNQPNNNYLTKQDPQKNTSSANATTIVCSALEEAIDHLVSTDPIVGLDYIIEYKKNLSQQGSFPFRCKLCNSAITRPSIIDHIIGSKHRMRYLKAKNESKYELITSLKLENPEKDAKIAEIAFHLELVYGRGHVTVNTEESPKGLGVSASWKETSERLDEPVLTLDKIPIGFEALSPPQHPEIDPSDFSLYTNPKKADPATVTQNETVNKLTSTSLSEVKKEITGLTNSDSGMDLPAPSSDLSCDAKSDANSAHFESNIKIDALQNLDEESNVKQTKHESEPSHIKRTLSPDASCRAKFLKTENGDDIKPSLDVQQENECPEIKSDDSSSETKEFSLDVFEKLSKSEISSEEEASVVVRIINMLMQMFLRYKLQHLSLEKVENLMKSLQIKSPENIEELKSLLKDSQVLEESEDNALLKMNTSLQIDSQEKVEQKFSCHSENNPSKTDSNESVNILHNPGQILNAASSSQSVFDIGMKSATGTPQNSGLHAGSSAQASSDITHSMSPSMTVGNSLSLKPPPFFGWSQTSESLTNQVSYGPVQGSQNMMWPTAYQHSQAQYSQMPYYQSYGNTVSGSQGYQTQYPVLPQASLKRAQPPLPPPPPPPPPSDPPLPSSVPLFPTAPLLPNPSMLPTPPPPPPYNNQPPPPPLP